VVERRDNQSFENHICFCHEGKNTLDLGPRYIFTGPNRLIKVSREPMIASGQSQMRALLSPISRLTYRLQDMGPA